MSLFTDLLRPPAELTFFLPSLRLIMDVPASEFSLERAAIASPEPDAEASTHRSPFADPEQLPSWIGSSPRRRLGWALLCHPRGNRLWPLSWVRRSLAMAADQEARGTELIKRWLHDLAESWIQLGSSAKVRRFLLDLAHEWQIPDEEKQVQAVLVDGRSELIPLLCLRMLLRDEKRQHDALLAPLGNALHAVWRPAMPRIALYVIALLRKLSQDFAAKPQELGSFEATEKILDAPRLDWDQIENCTKQLKAWRARLSVAPLTLLRGVYGLIQEGGAGAALAAGVLAALDDFFAQGYIAYLTQVHELTLQAAAHANRPSSFIKSMLDDAQQIIDALQEMPKEQLKLCAAMDAAWPAMHIYATTLAATASQPCIKAILSSETPPESALKDLRIALAIDPELELAQILLTSHEQASTSARNAAAARTSLEAGDLGACMKKLPRALISELALRLDCSLDAADKLSRAFAAEGSAPSLDRASYVAGIHRACESIGVRMSRAAKEEWDPLIPEAPLRPGGLAALLFPSAPLPDVESLLAPIRKATAAARGEQRWTTTRLWASWTLSTRELFMKVVFLLGIGLLLSGSVGALRLRTLDRGYAELQASFDAGEDEKIVERAPDLIRRMRITRDARDTTIRGWLTTSSVRELLRHGQAGDVAKVRHVLDQAAAAGVLNRAPLGSITTEPAQAPRKR